MPTAWDAKKYIPSLVLQGGTYRILVLKIPARVPLDLHVRENLEVEQYNYTVPLCDDGGRAAVCCAGRWSVFARSLSCVRPPPCVFEQYRYQVPV